MDGDCNAGVGTGVGETEFGSHGWDMLLLHPGDVARLMKSAMTVSPRWNGYVAQRNDELVSAGQTRPKMIIEASFVLPKCQRVNLQLLVSISREVRKGGRSLIGEMHFQARVITSAARCHCTGRSQ
jgi:hypothetical protein